MGLWRQLHIRGGCATRGWCGERRSVASTGSCGGYVRGTGVVLAVTFLSGSLMLGHALSQYLADHS